jgi:hypothetical protein
MRWPGEQLVSTRQLATAAGRMLPAVLLLFASLAGEQLVSTRQLATAAGRMLPAVLLLFALLAGVVKQIYFILYILCLYQLFKSNGAELHHFYAAQAPGKCLLQLQRIRL